MKNPVDFKRYIDLPSNVGANTPSQNGQAINVQVQTNNDSYIDLKNQAILNPMQAPGLVPNALGQTIVSNTGGGAAAITAYFLNEDIYNATASNNGSGAASVSNTYADGWSGNGYNALSKSVNSGLGILCYGFTLEFITTATGAENPSGLTAANPTYLTSNFVGNGQAPIGIPLNAGKRNTQYLSGTMTVLKSFYLSAANQFSYGVPVGNTVNLTVLTTPQ